MMPILSVNRRAVRRAAMLRPQAKFMWLVFLFLLAQSVRALWLEPLSLDQLTEQASLILHGTVRSKSCQRDPQGRIYTKVDLEVAEMWKGSLIAKRFTIVHGGGILGDKRVEISGQVEYAIGEEVVAFLVLNQRGEGVTLGLMQGKFRVGKDAKTGELLAQNPFHGTDDTSERIGRAGTSAASSRLTLADLKRRVQGGER
jgi:hypothetical protein